jgi:hypothetical protein
VVHYLPATRSSSGPFLAGRIIDIEDDIITVELEDEIRRVRNHEVARLAEIAGRNGRVRIAEDYPSIL